MNQKTSWSIGVSLLMIAICFIGYAMNHPEAAFPWSNRVTLMLYGMYSWLIFKFLLDIPLLKKVRNNSFKGSLLRTAIFFSFAGISFWIEISGETVGIDTLIRGFVVIGGMDVGIENFSVWRNRKNDAKISQ